MMLRIVHAVSSDNFAGTERYIATVAAGQSQAGHEVVVVGGDQRAMAAALGPGSRCRLLSAASAWATTRALRRIGRADVIHAHLTAAEFAAAVAAPTLGAAIVATRHIAARRGSSLPARMAGRWIRRQVDDQIAISEYVASMVDGPSVVIHDPVADCDQAPLTDRVVLVAQRLEPEKDTETALRGFAASGLAGEGWRLVIAGDGSMRSRLESLAATLHGSDAIEFVGWVSDLDRRRAGASMFLATAAAEPFGLSVVEAMAAGIPTIATGSGGHLETVGAIRPDLLYAPGDHVACAALLRRFADDRALRASTGAELRAFQQSRFSLGQHLAQLENRYAAALGRTPTAA